VIPASAAEDDGSTAHLVVIDTTVNDLLGQNRPDLTGDIPACYEGLIRYLRTSRPEAALFGFLSSPPHYCKKLKSCAYVKGEAEHIMRHYGVPFVDYVALFAKHPQLAKAWGTGLHPDWQNHQIMADVITTTWSNAWRKFCHGGKALAAPALLQSKPASSGNTFIAAKRIERVMLCDRPLTSYSAHDFRKHSVRPKFQVDAWEFDEDLLRRRPSWSSSARGSNISFSVRLGKDPKLAIIYLRSYNGFGEGKLQVVTPKKAFTFTLPGQWGLKSSEKYVFTLPQSPGQSKLPPDVDAEVVVTNLDKQFKIYEVISC